MQNISKSIKKVDHDVKITGKEIYVGDYMHASDGGRILTGRLLRAKCAHGIILNIKVPDMPEGYTYVSAEDVPVNVCFYPITVGPVMDDKRREDLLNACPVFADKEVLYYGQPVGLIAGPDGQKVRELISLCTVECEPLPAITSLDEATEALFSIEREVGNPDAAFKDADFIFEDRITTGHQYQGYLEPQGIMAEYDGKTGVYYIHGSMQCPYTLRQTLACTLNTDESKIIVKQDATGGAFGGKEEFPSYFAPQVAAAAKKCNKAVRVILDRSEDLQFNSKRHPSDTKIRLAVKNNHVIGMEVNGKLNTGAFISTGADVLKRYGLTFPGPYEIPNLKIKVSAMKTNTPPCGAFRGFGTPQSCFASEIAMAHLAKKLGIPESEFKLEHTAKCGGINTTGGTYKHEVPLKKMFEKAEKATSYLEKKERYAKQPKHRIARGIGFAFGFQGTTFIGCGEWAFGGWRVMLEKDENDRVTIYCSQADMGQGVRTAFCKIAAETLSIPFDNVKMDYPVTSFECNTGGTVASRSVMIVGSIVKKAAEELKSKWIPGKKQSAEAHFEKPAHVGPFDETSLIGDAFMEFVWNCSVIEVSIDMCSGKINIEDVYCIFDVGTPIDENILRGQMEGGLLQAVGYAALEKLVINEKGWMYNTGFPDYHIPVASDVPNIRVDFYDSEYEAGPFGAKAAGELPFAGIPAAYAMAVEQALGTVKPISVCGIPFRAENVIEAISEDSQ